MVDPSVPPVRRPLRRLPRAVVDEVSARIDRNFRARGGGKGEHIREAVSPLVVGRKRDGSVRLCVDMRQVNRAVVTDGYPLSRIDGYPLPRIDGYPLPRIDSYPLPRIESVRVQTFLEAGKRESTW